jgi:hypothetical protein
VIEFYFCPGRLLCSVIHLKTNSTMAAIKKEVDGIENSHAQGSRVNLSTAAVSTPNLQAPSSPNMTLAKKSSESQFEMSEILLPAHSTFPQSNSFIGQLMKW